MAARVTGPAAPAGPVIVRSCVAGPFVGTGVASGVAAGVAVGADPVGTTVAPATEETGPDVAVEPEHAATRTPAVSSTTIARRIRLSG